MKLLKLNKTWLGGLGFHLLLTRFDPTHFGPNKFWLSLDSFIVLIHFDLFKFSQIHVIVTPSNDLDMIHTFETI